MLAVHVLDMAPHGLRESSRSLGYVHFLGDLGAETRHVSMGMDARNVLS